MTPSTEEPRAARRRELDRLQEELATRVSTLHYAHAAVSFVFGGMVLAAAALAARSPGDAQRPELALAVAAAGACLWAYALVRALLGRRAQVREHQRFEVLKALRRELNLEDPSALLPR